MRGDHDRVAALQRDQHLVDDRLDRRWSRARGPPRLPPGWPAPRSPSSSSRAISPEAGCPAIDSIHADRGEADLANLVLEAAEVGLRHRLLAELLGLRRRPSPRRPSRARPRAPRPSSSNSAWAVARARHHVVHLAGRARCRRGSGTPGRTRARAGARRCAPARAGRRCRPAGPRRTAAAARPRTPPSRPPRCEPPRSPRAGPREHAHLAQERARPEVVEHAVSVSSSSSCISRLTSPESMTKNDSLGSPALKIVRPARTSPSPCTAEASR